MPQQIRDLIRFRLLNGWRASVSTRSGGRALGTLLLRLVTPVILFTLMARLWNTVFSRAAYAGGPDDIAALSGATTIVAALLFLAVAGTEFLKEAGLAGDQAFLELAPLEPRVTLGYRAAFALVAALPYCAAFVLAPVTLVWSAVTAAGPRTVALATVVLHFGLLLPVAFLGATLVLRAAVALGLSRHAVLAMLYAGVVVPAAAALLYLVEPSHWSALVAAARAHAALSPAAGIFSAAVARDMPAAAGRGLLSLIGAAALAAGALGATLRLWPAAARAPLAVEPTRRLTRRRFRGARFSRRWRWAVLQKDALDLVRNPEHRYSLLGLIVIAALAFYGEARSKADPSLHSARLLRSSLNLVHLVPLLFSPRTVSGEHRMLDLYRLVLPSAGDLLQVKLAAQAPVNCLLALAAALPLFLGLRPGFSPLETLFLAGAVVLFVPMFTALALALGIYFPLRAASASPLGLRLPGVVGHMLVGTVVYALLLETYVQLAAARAVPRLLAAAMGCAGAFTLALSVALFLGARRRLARGL